MPLQLVIIRLFEGYWPKIFYPFEIIGKWIHRSKFDNIQNDEDKELENEQDNEKKNKIMSKYQLKRLSNYPERDRILPTGLGNILRAAEDFVKTKYGLDSIITWTRLYILLPDSVKTLLNDQRMKLDLSTRLSFIFLISTIISSIFFVKISLLSLIPIAIFILLVISYKGSKQVAIGYGQLIHTAYDLYRFDLLKQLKIALPKNTEEEKKKGQEISSFLVSGEGLPENFEYEHDSESESLEEESKEDSKN